MDATGQKPTRWEITGVAVEHLIQARLIAKGFVVSQPTFDAGYDLVVDHEGVINKVQIRSTSSICASQTHRKHKYYRVKVRSVSGLHIFCVYIIPTNTVYLIPWHIVKEKHTISFPLGKESRYDEYKENYDILKTPH